MKNKIIIFLIIIAIISIAAIKIVSNKKEKQEIYNRINKEFDVYDKEISVNELVTLINKAINTNDNNMVKEDENNYYIENTTNSIKIEVKFLLNDDVFKMEKLYKNDLNRLAELYATQKFKCKEIKYHKSTGIVKYLYFEELE